MKRWTLRSVVIASTLLVGAPMVAAQTAGRRGSDTTAEPTSRVAVFRLHGEIREAPPSIDLGFDLEQKLSMYRLLERIRKGRTDDSLKAVVLIFDKPQIGLAQMQELRRAMGELKAAGKDVYAYLETARMGSYTLATAASKVVIVPTGDIQLTGIYVQQAYFKTLMDKIGVEADIEHVGAYKGAGEPFTRTGPSDEAKEQLNWIVQDIFDQLVADIAESRQMPVEEVKALVDKGPFMAKDALAAKLVDEVAYAEDFTASLRERYGENTVFDHKYGRKKGPELDFSNIFSLFKSFGDIMNQARAGGKDAIAVVYVDGMIVSGKTEESLFGDSGTVGSTTVRRALAKAREDDKIKAVVLRVDSPGGSALASDVIWHAAEELKGSKPFVVSMGNVAASGGYYVSAGSATIFAEPGTITGSIGVVGGKVITKGLWDWIGVTFYETKIGQNADLYSTDRRFDERQRKIIRDYMEKVYGEFTDRVKKGRGDKLKKDLDELAGGRVYTGKQALALGLVDRLGGLSDAIRYAADQANISDYEVRQLPEAKNFVDALLEGLTGESKDDGSRDIEASAGGVAWTTQAPAIRELLPMLRKADPERYNLVLRSLLRIELLGSENILMALPAELVVR